MAKVSYAPDQEQVAAGGLPDNTSQFGYNFTGDKPVEVTDPAHLRKFSTHPHFKVSGTVPTDQVVRTAAERESATLGTGSKETVIGAANRAPVAVPVNGAPEIAGPVTPGQADKPDGDSDLRAVHRGRGSFSVMQGDNETEVLSGLTKDEAEDFNNLSAKEKASFIKARQA